MTSPTPHSSFVMLLLVYYCCYSSMILLFSRLSSWTLFSKSTPPQSSNAAFIAFMVSRMFSSYIGRSCSSRSTYSGLSLIINDKKSFKAIIKCSISTMKRIYDEQENIDGSMKEETDLEVKAITAEFTTILTIEISSEMLFQTPMPLEPSALNLTE